MTNDGTSPLDTRARKSLKKSAMAFLLSAVHPSTASCALNGVPRDASSTSIFSTALILNTSHQFRTDRNPTFAVASLRGRWPQFWQLLQIQAYSLGWRPGAKRDRSEAHHSRRSG